MKILLTIAGRQLGQALCALVPPGLELISKVRQEMDLHDAEVCCSTMHHYRPDWDPSAAFQHRSAFGTDSSSKTEEEDFLDAIRGSCNRRWVFISY